jgi:hypothetical protein
MSETTTQMQDFLTRQAKVCHDNCEIEKDLYNEDSEMSMESAFLQVLRIYPVFNPVR